MHSQLLSASYKGVSFPVPDSEVSGGRNNIQHLYPDKAKHYMEDNGGKPTTFRIEILYFGLNAKDQFLALQAVLEAPGPGTLLHPWLGAKFVVCDEYSAHHTQNDSGVLAISLTFTETGAPSLPSLSVGIGSVVSGLTASALKSMFSTFELKYSIPSTFLNANRIADIANSLGSKALKEFASVQGMPDLVTSLASVITIYNPKQMASAFYELYNAPINDDIETDVTTLYDGWRAIARTLTTDPTLMQEFAITTVNLKERAEAISIFRSVHYGAVLVNLCESMALKEYVTAEQATYDQELLISIQTKIIVELFPESRLAINEIVTQTLEYLRALEVQLPKIETLTLHDWPVGPLAYQLYGNDTNRTQTLIDINRGKNLMLYDGSAEVLRGE